VSVDVAKTTGPLAMPSKKMPASHLTQKQAASETFFPATQLGWYARNHTQIQQNETRISKPGSRYVPNIYNQRPSDIHSCDSTPTFIKHLTAVYMTTLYTSSTQRNQVARQPSFFSFSATIQTAIALYCKDQRHQNTE